MDFRYRLMRLMSGRYGTDKLFYGIFAVAMVLSFINLFIRSILLQLVVYALVVFAVFRMLSRNIEARRRENAYFCEKLNFLKRRRDFYNQKKADRCHVYKKCPECKAVLRLPYRPGVHKTACPRCGKEFTVKVKER
ncbi:MAG: hypothetical protein IKD04_02085 [Clostridia bacterium]|nr:hypothetical protein [Clostridia bacterium]